VVNIRGRDQEIKNMVSDNKTRIVGIDYARAFFSVCVVGVHTGYFLPSYIFDPEIYFTNEFSFSDFVNFYIHTFACCSRIFYNFQLPIFL
jgi:hypothetical protein